MKRRLNIAAGLIHNSRLLIMDEPTVGIDPQSRNHILETVKNLRHRGITVVYTSQYVEEVEYLCDRVAIMDAGRIIAEGALPEPVEAYEMAILGVLVMFVTLNIITSAGGYILEEKQTGTWQRILTSTTSYWHIMTGYFIQLFMIALVQSIVLLLSGKYLFGAPWN